MKFPLPFLTYTFGYLSSSSFKFFVKYRLSMFRHMLKYGKNTIYGSWQRSLKGTMGNKKRIPVKERLMELDQVSSFLVDEGKPFSRDLKTTAIDVGLFFQSIGFYRADFNFLEKETLDLLHLKDSLHLKRSELEAQGLRLNHEEELELVLLDSYFAEGNTNVLVRKEIQDIFASIEENVMKIKYYVNESSSSTEDTSESSGLYDMEYFPFKNPDDVS